MSPMALGERAATSAYGMLASRLGEILEEARAPCFSPSEEDQHLLQSGAELLDRCALGQQLVEGRLKKTAAPEKLRIAISTLALLTHLQEGGALSELATALRNLAKSSSVDAVSEATVENLRKLFTDLSQYLLEDLASESLQEAAPERLIRSAQLV